MRTVVGEYKGHKVVICTCACEGTSFHVFSVDDMDHVHMECVSCGTSWCPATQKEADGPDACVGPVVDA